MDFLKGFTFNFYILDPVGLFGEGQYNLLSLKEISVTDSFMGLDKDFRKCQNIETYNSCKTRLYIEQLRQKCGCLPFSLKMSAKVSFIILKSIYIYVNNLQDALCMTKKEITCSQTITTPNSTFCLRLKFLMTYKFSEKSFV